MKCRPYQPAESLVIEALFLSVFANSEGEVEGKLIGNLVKELMADTDKKDLCGFVADDKEQMVGVVFFSRLTFEKDIDAFILSPVAVRSNHQGKGIGQKLINYGLGEMTNRGVNVVITYGDPAFYTKVGFLPLSEDVIKPPFELSQPEGWLGQSLSGESIEVIPGRCTCVKAFENAAYW